MTRLLVPEEKLKLSPPSFSAPSVEALRKRHKLLSALNRTIAPEAKPVGRVASSKSVASAKLPQMNIVSNRKMLKKHQTESASTFDRDFWIDISLVFLSGGVSFLALKCVEFFLLTDAVIGLF
jgi:hypothetical protein